MKTINFHITNILAFLVGFLLTSAAHAANYTLSLSVQGSGNVAPSPTNATYPAGVVVTITATPNAGWYFANWSGDSNSTVNPLYVTMNANKSFTGNFLAFPVYTLDLVTNGLGAIALNPPGGSYDSNSVVSATANPANGWVFAGWSGETNTTANPLSLALDADNTLTATFAQLPAIDEQPVGVTNITGSTVSFVAQAVGTAPLAYQWFYSGGSLNGATGSTLTLTNVSPNQAGNYWIVVTNSYGSMTSQMASLVITNVGGPTNVVTSPIEASLVAAINLGGWVSLGFSGTVILTNTIDITNNVVLDGQNVAVTISGGNAVQLFNVAPGVSFTLTNLTLANGNSSNNIAEGGAIFNNDGIVTLVGCTLTNDKAQTFGLNGSAMGGAIYNQNGTIFMLNSSLADNTAGSGSGDPYSGQPNCGGAIYSEGGTTIIVGCNFAGNQSQGSPSAAAPFGGALFQASGSSFITNTDFTMNESLGGNAYGSGAQGESGYGGALGINGGSAIIDHANFINNLSKSGTGQTGAGSAGGGAIYSAGTLLTQSSTFSGNQSLSGISPDSIQDGMGGAIYNAGAAVLRSCSLYSNYVQGSAGAVHGYEDNGGNGLGGAIFNSSSLNATNCTIALNSAVAGSGLAAGFEQTTTTNGTALGGGIYNSINATSVLMNVTIASNYCIASGPEFTGINGFAAGAEIANANTNASLHLHNSIIADSGTNSNAYGPIGDDGFNMSDDGSASLFSGSSYNFTGPQLGPLANYGGPTLCMALLPGSPAIDSADPNDFPGTDQRGYIRPIGAGPDMGAYEYDSYLPGVTNLTISASANNVVISFLTTSSGTYYLQSSTNLTDWIDVDTNGPFASPTNLSQTISIQGFNQRYFRLLIR